MQTVNMLFLTMITAFMLPAIVVAEDAKAGPVQTLEKEHKIIQKVAVRTGKVAAALAEDRQVDAVKIEKIHKFFVNFADACHHAKEEKELFPILRNRQVSEPILDFVILQHKEGRVLLAGVKQELEAYKKDRESADIEELSRCLQEYSLMIQRHIDVENNFLWPRARKALSDAQQEKLQKAFIHIETEELGKGFHKKYHALAMDILGRNEHE